MTTVLSYKCQLSLLNFKKKKTIINSIKAKNIFKINISKTTPTLSNDVMHTINNILPYSTKVACHPHPCNFVLYSAIDNSDKATFAKMKEAVAPKNGKRSGLKHHRNIMKTIHK